MWGYNYQGQIGDGTTVDKHVPTEITNQFNLAIGETITSISLGYSSSAAITSEGRLFTWGDNYFGQLGNGTTVDKHVPTEITNQFNLAIGETITTLSMSNHHSSTLTSEGRVFMWGYNSYGQLGDGTTVSKYIPTEITDQFNFAIGEIISSISLGSSHSLAITSEGRLFTWGDNYFGQLGNDDAPFKKNVPTEISYQFKFLSVYEEIIFDFDEELIDEFISYQGYTFDGWYTDSNLSHPYNGTRMPNYPLYALYIKD